MNCTEPNRWRHPPTSDASDAEMQAYLEHVETCPHHAALEEEQAAALELAVAFARDTTTHVVSFSDEEDERLRAQIRCLRDWREKGHRIEQLSLRVRGTPKALLDVQNSVQTTLELSATPLIEIWKEADAISPEFPVAAIPISVTRGTVRQRLNLSSELSISLTITRIGDKTRVSMACGSTSVLVRSARALNRWAQSIRHLEPRWLTAFCAAFAVVLLVITVWKGTSPSSTSPVGVSIRNQGVNSPTVALDHPKAKPTPEVKQVPESTKPEEVSLAVAVNLSNLGDVANVRGDLAKAEQYYRQALAIQDRLAPHSLAVATTLNNLGVVAKDLGNLDKAEEYYRQALAVHEKLGPASPVVASILNNLGTVLSERGDRAKAEDYYRQALAMGEEVAPGIKDNPQEPPPILAFALVPRDTPRTARRGAGEVEEGGNVVTVVTIPPGQYRIRLELSLDDAHASNYQDYEVSVRTMDGNDVWFERGQLRASAPENTPRTILVTMPPGKLQPGEYLVKLSGVSPFSSKAYFFEVPVD